MKICFNYVYMRIHYVLKRIFSTLFSIIVYNWYKYIFKLSLYKSLKVVCANALILMCEVIWSYNSVYQKWVDKTKHNFYITFHINKSRFFLFLSTRHYTNLKRWLVNFYYGNKNLNWTYFAYLFTIYKIKRIQIQICMVSLFSHYIISTIRISVSLFDNKQKKNCVFNA